MGSFKNLQTPKIPYPNCKMEEYLHRLGLWLGKINFPVIHSSLPVHSIPQMESFLTVHINLGLFSSTLLLLKGCISWEPAKPWSGREGGCGREQGRTTGSKDALVARQGVSWEEIPFLRPLVQCSEHTGHCWRLNSAAPAGSPSQEMHKAQRPWGSIWASPGCCSKCSMKKTHKNFSKRCSWAPAAMESVPQLLWHCTDHAEWHREPVWRGWAHCAPLDSSADNKFLFLSLLELKALRQTKISCPWQWCCKCFLLFLHLLHTPACTPKASSDCQWWKRK